MKIDEEIDKFYSSETEVECIGLTRKLISDLARRGYHVSHLPDQTKIHPATAKIDYLFHSFIREKSKTGLEDEVAREDILKIVDKLEELYIAKRTCEEGSSGDWITIEVFPGLRNFFGKVLGTGREFGDIGYFHWVEDLKIIETYLLKNVQVAQQKEHTAVTTRTFVESQSSKSGYREAAGSSPALDVSDHNN